MRRFIIIVIKMTTKSPYVEPEILRPRKCTRKC